MNILIYGNVASGKTLLAELLQEYYEREGQPTTVFDNERANVPRGILAQTRGVLSRHAIVVTQPYAAHCIEGGDSPFDYYYHLTRSSHA